MVCSLLGVAMGGIAEAGPMVGNAPAYVVMRPDTGIVAPRSAAMLPLESAVRTGDSARVVVREVSDGVATVDRSLAHQPVRPWLTELRLANTTTIYIDPLRNYRPYAWRGIDENHTILRAQRAGLSRLALPARVVVNPHVVAEDDAAGRDIQPRAILRIRKAPDEAPRKVALAE